jgi:hypothetical protein
MQGDTPILIHFTGKAYMKKIDEGKLETDTQARFEYLAEFIGFGAEDIETILGSASLVAPVVPDLVDAVYAKLFQYDATWRHFVKKQSGFDGSTPMSMEDLPPDHPTIKFRKDKLSRYLAKLVTGPYNASMVQYLDMVGKIHTEKAGSIDIYVPLVQMNALMGFVADALTATILSLKLPSKPQEKVLRAFGKLLWIQNDLISRHYQK